MRIIWRGLELQKEKSWKAKQAFLLSPACLFITLSEDRTCVLDWQRSLCTVVQNWAAHSWSTQKSECQKLRNHLVGRLISELLRCLPWLGRFFVRCFTRRMNFLALGFFTLWLLLSPQLSTAASLNAVLQLLVFLILAHVPALVREQMLLLPLFSLSWSFCSHNVDSSCICIDCGIAQSIKNYPIEIRLPVGCHTWTLPGPGVSSPSESSPSSVPPRTRCLGGFKKWWIIKTVPRVGLTGGHSSQLLTPLLDSGPYSDRPLSVSFLMSTKAKQAWLMAMLSKVRIEKIMKISYDCIPIRL